MAKCKSLILLIRPGEWVKNLFILLPLLFSGKIHYFERQYALLTAIGAFCAASSLIYVINDLVDRKRDQNHPVKKKRPIASGAVTSAEAIVTIIVLFVVNALFLFSLCGDEKKYIVSYVVLNILYSAYLKKIPIIDVTVISIGFVLRVLSGGLASDVPVSKWLILMTFLLAMCLGFGKRREELFVASSGTGEIRPALAGYNVEFINMALVFMTVTTVICYIMYTLSPDVVERMGTDNIYYTSFFVILGLLRFLQIAIVENKSGSPTKILIHDRFTQTILLLWFVAFSLVIYMY